MSSSFGAEKELKVNGTAYQIYRLDALENSARLPVSIRILLENLLRHEDGVTVTATDIKAVANWDPQAEPSREIQYRPARVLMQDFTGVPAVVDLAAMRDAMVKLGGSATDINPLQPAELVIDHSVQVDHFGDANAFDLNAEIEFQRNQERYQFLKWGQSGFSSLKVVPPDTGIVHQVNLEYLARVVYSEQRDDKLLAFPDTLVGTDSHTTMVNGIGVLGWGVGGIEAEASMLGQPISMLVPKVVGVKLVGKLPEGSLATDLVLTIVERLREHGVVGKFVEFYGPAIATMPLGDRATIANMAPEYGATCGLFPVDQETLDYLRLTNRSEDQIALVEAYAKAQGMFHTADSPEAEYSETLEIDLSAIEPSLAGPKRPQDRVPLKDAKVQFEQAVEAFNGGESQTVTTNIDGATTKITDGDVVIAAITSCTNTSNPSVMMAAGLLAKKAVESGLSVKPWVKTSLGPGSRVVMQYLEQAGLDKYLDTLGFDLVGYGCTTCIGNSGPLPEEVSKAISDGDLTVTSVLSGNRNFEGRVHAEVRMNYLASPPLVVAYALTGTMNVDLYRDPLGVNAEGQPVFFKDIWPSSKEIAEAISENLTREGFIASYARLFDGDSRWQSLEAPAGSQFQWDPDSTYIRHPPYFEEITLDPDPITDIEAARCLAWLGDSVTTDHISPAGAIKADSPAGEYLTELGVKADEFNSYGSRRGNHEVMMRGTFANIRLRNRLLPGSEGGVTRHLPSGDEMSIYDAAMRYKEESVPVIVIAGKEYGSGSSRDWAAKGPALQGVRAVIAESYERIHRTNLVCMGILPLQFLPGESAESLGLTGEERFFIPDPGDQTVHRISVMAKSDKGSEKEFSVTVRIDTPNEVDYFKHGGILHYVLRKMASESSE
ncbi:MAG: aconitate hydratase 1 [gamma proteobacterium symbiont of Stewartia floridana]|nr:aconitate hydratase AcnA [Candidatus Thiodiazotropha taylori]RLW55043.1 MAG: aconitate hydratase 1 [gamma proteobacterium symbiont of Stewartia floridana]MCG7906132.1 aconitate hydratase AcnA [Candidatus Thiodiazotropha taylori]MCG7924585.1 aconitate hydratase AcnA [Candidatus Thiodiazotropha taylori]MCG7936165.1 aconitate hydratase AcnA [Candidatus Thiodiazotropha taylori]